MDKLCSLPLELARSWFPLQNKERCQTDNYKSFALSARSLECVYSVIRESRIKEMTLSQIFGCLLVSNFSGKISLNYLTETKEPLMLQYRDIALDDISYASCKTNTFLFLLFSPISFPRESLTGASLTLPNGWWCRILPSFLPLLPTNDLPWIWMRERESQRRALIWILEW